MTSLELFRQAGLGGLFKRANWGWGDISNGVANVGEWVGKKMAPVADYIKPTLTGAGIGAAGMAIPSMLNNEEGESGKDKAKRVLRKALMGAGLGGVVGAGAHLLTPERPAGSPGGGRADGPKPPPADATMDNAYTREFEKSKVPPTPEAKVDYSPSKVDQAENVRKMREGEQQSKAMEAAIPGLVGSANAHNRSFDPLKMNLGDTNPGWTTASSLFNDGRFETATALTGAAKGWSAAVKAETDGTGVKDFNKWLEATRGRGLNSTGESGIKKFEDWYGSQNPGMKPADPKGIKNFAEWLNTESPGMNPSAPENKGFLPSVVGTNTNPTRPSMGITVPAGGKPPDKLTWIKNNLSEDFIHPDGSRSFDPRTAGDRDAKYHEYVEKLKKHLAQAQLEHDKNFAAAQTEFDAKQKDYKSFQASEAARLAAEAKAQRDSYGKYHEEEMGKFNENDKRYGKYVAGKTNKWYRGAKGGAIWGAIPMAAGKTIDWINEARLSPEQRQYINMETPEVKAYRELHPVFGPSKK